MIDRRVQLHDFLISQGVSADSSQLAVNNLGGLFTAAETRRVILTPASQIDQVALLEAAKDVLQDDCSGGLKGFRVTAVQAVPILDAQHLRSKSAGTVRPTDWPPRGISSFGVSALMFLRYSPDMHHDVFGAVHQAAHDALFDKLRYAALPDGGLLGREWIVPWTTITDSVFFYLTHTVMKLDEDAERLGRFIEFMPGALSMGFSLDSEGNTSGELVVIAG